MELLFIGEIFSRYLQYGHKFNTINLKNRCNNVKVKTTFKINMSIIYDALMIINKE